MRILVMHPFLLHTVAALALSSGSYDEDKAKQLYMFSSAAYCHPESITNWDCKPCQAIDASFRAQAITNSTEQTQGLVGSGNGRIIVSFRGSENIPNWIDDIDMRKMPYPYSGCSGCEVHSGFYAAWASLQDQTLRLVNDEVKKQPHAKIYVTGHSLGAAMAVLCAADLAFTHGLSIEAVYTFGDPRAGNSKFVELFEAASKETWRVTHWRDPVPHLVPEALGFAHVPTEVFYTQDSSNFTVCNGSGEDDSCSNQFWVDYDVDDHLNYFSTKTGIGGC